MTAKQTSKQRLQSEASALGLSTDGTATELKRRIAAANEAAAQAIEGDQLELLETPQRLPVHPTNAALIGGVIGAAWHFLG